MKNRQIKFRAWDSANVGVYNSETDPKRMSFFGGEFSMDDNQNSLIFFTPEGKQPPYGDHNSIERYTLMQFTGLLDKNGKEIWEGDILIPTKLRMRKYVVEFSAGRFIGRPFGVNPRAISNISDLGDLKIAGNIYEHPHLLTSEVN